MVVESRLPEMAFVSLAIFVSGDLFESVDEFHEVADICHAFGDEMKMVWHQAVGVEGECILSGEVDEFG